MGSALKVVEDQLGGGREEFLMVRMGAVRGSGVVRGCVGEGVVVRKDILDPGDVGVGSSRAQRGGCTPWARVGIQSVSLRLEAS